MTTIHASTPPDGIDAGGLPKMFDLPHSGAEPTVYGLDKRVSLIEHMIKVQHKQLESINQNLNRIVWLVLVAVVGAILSLVVRSGGVPL